MATEQLGIWKIRLEVASRIATLVGIPLLWVALAWAREIDRTVAKQGAAIEFLLTKQAEISANVARGTEATNELAERMAKNEGADAERGMRSR